MRHALRLSCMLTGLMLTGCMQVADGPVNLVLKYAARGSAALTDPPVAADDRTLAFLRAVEQVCQQHNDSKQKK